MAASDIYNEISVKISDSNFIFFIDKGFFLKIRESSEIHSHKYNEIIFVFKGNAGIPVKDKIYKLEENDMIIVPPDEKHSINSNKDTGIIVISFWTEKNNFDEISIYKNFKGSGAFLRLLDYYYNNYKHKKELVYSCITEIAALISDIRQNNSASLDTTTLESDNYRKYIIDKYLQDNYNKSPSLGKLSNQLNLSTVHTHRILKNMYKKTFRDIILSLRMERAKSLLSETDKPIYKVSLEVGYTTIHNFFTAFKKANGITPMQYRKTRKI